ncbi:hypothetical protein K9U39_07750 [Rhodoblastus acidophilus]|uniref:Uncharacterized protein n=1 Tax=Candidatus Rhodoblastus alkanivorans TaxID=2954117 RepID=A0ABS9Z7D4_9HYPH|nr:hypothetical protein [Candidatus Rhodoblastus alkanivorans]MCI4678265.1 hypothetical protein [Candidatus Rhodoblastus alkanivorans]MCI4683523.1 hypothetical protein [Candidatus Rhodoblastus alkanivorans]MDI4640838.1 hypothetical protein [Rhodoblastus acidophilus]
MATALTPGEFAQKYLKMRVYIYPPEEGGPDNSALAPSGWQDVSFANYRLSNSAYRETIWNDIAPRLKDKTDVKLISIAGAPIEDSLTPAELWNAFRYPWVGKGSPEQAQIAIQLVYRFHKAHTALNAFLAADFVGLDCNGFAGNYYQRAMQAQGADWKTQNNLKDPGPTTDIEGLFKLGGRAAEIKKLDDIDSSKIYVLAECDPKTGVIADPIPGQDNTWGHVMLTEPGVWKKLADGKIGLSVSEATADAGRKLRTGVDYTIYPGKTVNRVSVFHVERGAPDDTLDVRIAEFREP